MTCGLLTGKLFWIPQHSGRSLRSYTNPWIPGNSRQVLNTVLGMMLVSLLGVQTVKAESYKSAQEAMAQASVFYNGGEFAKAQEPLEAALKLTDADDIKARVRIHRALIACYRLVPEMEKMAETVEYIIQNSDSAAEKSLTRTSYMSYLLQRGLTDDAVKRYEKVLKKDKDAVYALYLLSEIYSRLKNDPATSIELTKRLHQLTGEADEIDVRETARLAAQCMRARKYEEAAKLYEKIGDLDETLAAWHWKEAASAWLKLDEKEKALAAARRSAETSGEQRNEQLTHFWHRALGDVFLATDQPQEAIPHFEKALATTKIQGYIDGTQKSLDQAKAAVKAE